jgi:hypothetical protein
MRTPSVAFACFVALSAGCEPARPTRLPKCSTGVDWSAPPAGRVARLVVNAEHSGRLDGENFADEQELNRRLNALLILGSADRTVAPARVPGRSVDLLVEATADLPATAVAHVLETVVECAGGLPEADLRAHLMLQPASAGGTRVLSVPTRSDDSSNRIEPAKKHVVAVVVFAPREIETRAATDAIWSVFVAPRPGVDGEITTLRDQSLAQASHAIAAADTTHVFTLATEVSASLSVQEFLDWVVPVLELRPDDLQWRVRK